MTLKKINLLFLCLALGTSLPMMGMKNRTPQKAPNKIKNTKIVPSDKCDTFWNGLNNNQRKVLRRLGGGALQNKLREYWTKPESAQTQKAPVTAEIPQQEAGPGILGSVYNDTTSALSSAAGKVTGMLTPKGIGDINLVGETELPQDNTVAQPASPFWNFASNTLTGVSNAASGAWGGAKNATRKVLNFAGETVSVDTDFGSDIAVLQKLYQQGEDEFVDSVFAQNHPESETATQMSKPGGSDSDSGEFSSFESDDEKNTCGMLDVCNASSEIRTPSQNQSTHPDTTMAAGAANEPGIAAGTELNPSDDKQSDTDAASLSDKLSAEHSSETTDSVVQTGDDSHRKIPQPPTLPAVSHVAVDNRTTPNSTAPETLEPISNVTGTNEATPVPPENSVKTTPTATKGPDVSATNPFRFFTSHFKVIIALAVVTGCALKLYADSAYKQENDLSELQESCEKAVDEVLEGKTDVYQPAIKVTSLTRLPQEDREVLEDAIDQFNIALKNACNDAESCKDMAQMRHHGVDKAIEPLMEQLDRCNAIINSCKQKVAENPGILGQISAKLADSLAIAKDWFAQPSESLHGEQ